ncbi:MAG: DNA polymerase III subunit delta [Endomicrobium sp.]|jgi:DNA polymerase-3 subunit delta|nr:DNA polymerase III subunit delta [Endomicrobium sp.]
MLNVRDFDNLISSGKTSKTPVYLFAGEELYLLEKCLYKIEKSLFVNNLNREVFYSLESSIEDILSALYTPSFSFFGEKRLIIVKNINKIKSSDAEKLINYLSNTVGTSCLVLLYFDDYKKEIIEKRRKLIAKCIASKNCTSVNCRKRYHGEVTEFIKNKFLENNRTASDDVVARIIEQNGVDLLNISNEIEKLLLFVGEEKNITVEDLIKICGYTKKINMYTLSFFIESKNFNKAMFVLEKLLTAGEDPIIILSVIASTIRRMLDAKSLIEEQFMSTVDVATKLKIHNFRAKEFFENLKSHNVHILKMSLQKILEADISIKTGNGNVRSALERIILYLYMSRDIKQ